MSKHSTSVGLRFNFSCDDDDDDDDDGVDDDVKKGESW